MTTEKTGADKAIDVATQIGNAVVKKFPKHVLYVRRYATGDDNGFVEIALRPENGTQTQEITTAYSDEYFLSANKENINDKAKRILNDFRVHFGVPTK